MEWDKEDFNCHPEPVGSADLPFTQKYLDECMRQRRVRPGMYGMKTAYERWIDFRAAQVRKYRQGYALKCSPGLGNEIRRIALGADLDL